MRALQLTLVLLCFLGLAKPVVLAQNITPDAQFQQAQQLAYQSRNYSEAIQLCRQLLQQYPDYLDARLLLGRLYYWNGQTTEALAELSRAYEQNPGYEDAALALADVLYFEKDYKQALDITQQGLAVHLQSWGLMERKATVLAAMGEGKAAYAIADSLLALQPDNSQLLALANQLRDYSFDNRIELTYDLTTFDKQYADAWHLAGISYSRQTGIGPVTGRLSYANRFGETGWQFEAEAYPKLSRTFYAYTGVAFADALPVFPKLRAGVSVFANLPRAWEAEAGIRYLYFDDAVYTYTFGAAKYLGNFWLNGRAYLTQANHAVANAYTFTTRYYLKGADNYVLLLLGYGVSPDDRAQAIRLNSTTKLQTYRAGAGYRFKLLERHIIGLNATYESVEYQPETRGNQLTIAALYQFRF